MILALLFWGPVSVMAQETSHFKSIAFDSLGVTPYQLYTTREAVTWISSSAGLWMVKRNELNGPVVNNGLMYDEKGKSGSKGVRIRQYIAEDSIRAMAQGPDSIFYFVAHDNFFVWRPNGVSNGLGFPPFIFPTSSAVSALWIHPNGDLLAGTRSDGLFIIEKGGQKKGLLESVESDWDNNQYVIRKGAKKIRQIKLGDQTAVYSIAPDLLQQDLVWVGTNKGLFTCHLKSGIVSSAFHRDSPVTVTGIYTGEPGSIWFSTLEKGMGVLDQKSGSFSYYPYKNTISSGKFASPINRFCYKSPGEFFVATGDSLPAIFNYRNRTFRFIRDPAFETTKAPNSDIAFDSLGRLLILRGGRLFIGDLSAVNDLADAYTRKQETYAPLFTGVYNENEKEIATEQYKPDLLKKLTLSHRQNTLLVSYDAPDNTMKNPLQFAWKIDGYSGGWIEMPAMKSDEPSFILLEKLNPGTYVLELKVRKPNGKWRTETANMIIVIRPPYWRSTWFLALVASAIVLILLLFFSVRARRIRNREKLKAKYEIDLLQLEAKALRSQMNPHFIYNCLNSIKSLMQENETEKGVNYLTTFSKLIRTLFNNADKKLISLYDEIETCKLYLQLESMRFDSKFSYVIDIAPDIDLKSIEVPALIIQPFIENAIWHGIIPKGNTGKLSLSVKRKGDRIAIIVDDDGVGRDVSRRNKSLTNVTHQSKGVNLTQARIELDNLIRQQEAGIEVIDKYDSQGLSVGTSVMISIKIPE